MEKIKRNTFKMRGRDKKGNKDKDINPGKKRSLTVPSGYLVGKQYIYPSDL